MTLKKIYILPDTEAQEPTMQYVLTMRDFRITVAGENNGRQRRVSNSVYIAQCTAFVIEISAPE